MCDGTNLFLKSMIVQKNFFFEIHDSTKIFETVIGAQDFILKSAGIAR